MSWYELFYEVIGKYLLIAIAVDLTLLLILTRWKNYERKNKDHTGNILCDDCIECIISEQGCIECCDR